MYNARMASEHDDLDFNGLTSAHPSLPAAWYFDPARHELEMRRIWQRHWLYVCRATELPAPRSFRTFEVGDQKLFLVRDEAGVLRGFHNTCRHRGSTLCTQDSGTLRTAAIVCPYHAWSYALDGKLQRITSKFTPAGFDAKEHALYPVSMREWRGFVFVSLAKDPPPFAASWDTPLTRLDGWPLEELQVGHSATKVLRCNWKIFWENYNECLHCPLVHPTLSQMVPIYGRALMEPRDDPQWKQHAQDEDPKYRGGVRRGAHTWSRDGQLVGKAFPGIAAEDLRTGYVYMTGLPSVFIVGHPDYVRVVRLRPLAPESTELHIEYLFSAETLADPAFDVQRITDFAGAVLREDAQVCELNQSGLRAAPHAQGVLMPEEYVVKQFQDWIRAEAGD